MAIRTARLTVTATPVVVTGTDDHRADQSVVLRPVGGDVYVGASDVTTLNGFLVRDGESLALDVESPVYAVSAGSVALHVLRAGVA